MLEVLYDNNNNKSNNAAHILRDDMKERGYVNILKKIQPIKWLHKIPIFAKYSQRQFSSWVELTTCRFPICSH
jgi:hypothetical protein